MASETATAQQIKGQYASIRLRSMQEDVAMFATELLRLKAQIICTKFQPQTILLYAAAQQMQPADQQLIPEALQLMGDSPLRSFRIEVAADSLVQLDEQQMKRDRMEFIQAFGGFLREALPVAQASPEITPMLIEVMKFGIGAFKQAKSMEGALDAALDQLKEKQAQPQQPRPDPEMMKLQAQQASDQARAQADIQAAQAKAQFDAQIQQAKIQAEVQIEQMKMQAAAQTEAQRQQYEAAMAQQKLQSEEQFNRWKTELEAATKIMVARIGANPGLDIPAMEAQQAASEKITSELGDHVKMAIDRMAGMHDAMLGRHDQTMNQMGGMMQMLAAPKRIVRGPDGRAAGVEVMTQ
jgi:DNA polymerase III gamma/tau subunit